VSDETFDELPPPIVPGVARALSPLVRRIALDVGGAAGPNTYLVGIDEIAVIDPGPANAAHLDAVAGCGGDRVRWILTTGAGDSSGAAKLAKATGAEILAVDGIGPKGASGKLAVGDTVLGTEFRLTVLDAPGVAEPRVLFFLEEERVVFAGDYLDVEPPPEITDPEAYREAVTSLRRLRLRGIAPAAGHLVESPVDRIDEIAPR
jgi:glyoxylase-like metal-dependent hydrolase (beta-lactamase superfamily II)